jgi:hypothetical protein
MNAAKRKRAPHPLAHLVSRCLPFFQGGWRPVILGLGLIGLFVGGAVYAWQRWGGQITQSEEYFVLPENIEVSPPPKWVKTDVKAEVVRDAGLTRLPLLDKQLTIKVAQAFEAHPWIERVTRVRKLSHPARLSVDLDYRQPVAMVEVVIETRPGLLPVDKSGVLLPPQDFSEEQIQDYLRISAPETTPAGKVGNPWGDPRVQGGARIAALLKDSWKTLGLHRLVASRPDSVHKPPEPLDAPTYDLFTRGGTRIIWGTAPRADNAADAVTALKKISRLLAFAKTSDGLDSGKPPKEIDLRSYDSGPRTAKWPTTPQG